MKSSAISRSDFIYVVVKIVVCGLKAIGLAPFYVQKNHTHGGMLSRRTRLFQHSKLGVVYNFLLVIPILFIKVKTIIILSGQNGSSMFGAVKKIVFILRETTGFTAACLPLIFWGLRRKEAVAILNLLFESSNRLSNLKQPPMKKRVIVLFIIHLNILIGLFVMLAIKVMNYTSFQSFGNSFLIYLPALVIFYYKAQYLGTVGFVAMKLQTINQCLTSYHVLINSSFFAVRNNRQAVANLITYHDEQLASIRLLRSVRATLIDLCKDIAKFFSLPILFSVIFSFIAFFYDGYDFFVDREHSLRRKLNTKGVSDIEWIVMLIWLYIYPITSLSVTVTRTKKDAKLTGKIVNKLLATARKGSEVRSELKQFSRELRHDNDDIFTAYGLFSLDSTLLLSILASTVTYFVILVQLRPPICDREPFCNCSTHP